MWTTLCTTVESCNFLKIGTVTLRFFRVHLGKQWNKLSTGLWICGANADSEPTPTTPEYNIEVQLYSARCTGGEASVVKHEKARPGRFQGGLRKLLLADYFSMSMEVITTGSSGRSQ